jgi:hypothetical protein
MCDQQTNDILRAPMRRGALFLLVASLVALLLASHWLARHRIYQVDECQNVYVARLLATGQARNAFTGVTLFLAPIAWITHNASHSVDMFATSRQFGWMLFWLNIFLIAVATGERIRSRRALLALVAAATLAPLWDYGFEVRHDNLLLTGLLLLWCVLRVFPNGLWSYGIAGALAVAIEFVAFKAFVYTIPISLVALAFPHPSHRTARARLAVAWLAGGLGAFVLLRLGYGVMGWWDVYVRDVSSISDIAARAARFGPLFTLRRLVNSMPLVTALAIAGLGAVFAEAWRRGRAGWNWDGLLPEALLLVVAFAALLVNPAPYPYNLVNFAPFVFVLGWRYTPVLIGDFRSRRALLPIAVVAVVAGHLAPFGGATWRHFQMTNTRQQTLMRLAEDLTSPQGDAVYDGIGMVPTRASINYQWFLHSLNVASLVKTPGARLREMLAARPAAVIIPSYRTDWLPSEDHTFIRERYVPLADDFWVLGRILPLGGGTFEVVHPGRYRVTGAEVSSIADTYVQSRTAAPVDSSGGAAASRPLAGSLDGVPLSGEVAELTTGLHRVECAPQCRPAIVWVGPRLNRLPRLSDRDHRFLFVNWY